MGVYHTPALLHVACDYLGVIPGGRYIDATLGGGGHTTEIVRRGGKVLGIDQDSDSLNACPNLNHLTKAQGNFMFLGDIAKKYGFTQVDGILFDLGVSSHQLDTPDRGFSYLNPGPLDMRMDKSQPVTAGQLINTLPLPNLVQIIRQFSNLNNAGQIAQKIITARPLKTTDQLAGLFTKPKVKQLVFQAFRITVNSELIALETALPQSLEILRPGGRLVVISFHSLEDRLVKKQFREWEAAGAGEVLTLKPLVPSLVETNQNPRSKSSKLRAFSKNV